MGGRGHYDRVGGWRLGEVTPFSRVCSRPLDSHTLITWMVCCPQPPGDVVNDMDIASPGGSPTHPLDMTTGSAALYGEAITSQYQPLDIG